MLMLRAINNNVYNKVIRRSFNNAKCFGTVTGKPILYGDEISPPVRFVMMTANILNVDLDFRKIDLFKIENRTDFFRKINPLQKVPVLVDNDTKICDSHAIALYLCQLENDQELYPADPIQRAKINQMLFFNSSTLFRLDSDLMTMYFSGKWPVDNMKIEEWYSALDFLEHHLEENDWLTGKKIHLCDICLVAVVTSLSSLVPLTKRHHRVQRWVKSFENLPFYEINKNGVTTLTYYIKALK